MQIETVQFNIFGLTPLVQDNPKLPHKMYVTQAGQFYHPAHAVESAMKYRRDFTALGKGFMIADEEVILYDPNSLSTSRLKPLSIADLTYDVRRTL